MKLDSEKFKMACSAIETICVVAATIMILYFLWSALPLLVTFD